MKTRVKLQKGIDAGVLAKQEKAMQRAPSKLLTGGAVALFVTIAATAIALTPASVSQPAPKAKPALQPRGTLAPFNNGKPANGAAWFGATLGDGKYRGNGWPSTADMKSVTDLGVKAVRLPFKPQYCFNPDGTLNQWVIERLARAIKYNTVRNVATVLDAHTYKPFSDPAVANFWSLFAPAMERAIGGPSPFFGVELANEPGRSNKDLSVWTEPLRETIHSVRRAGYQGYIFAGAGDWNNMTFLRKALVEVERTGGALAMDPLDRTIYTGHDYWNKDNSPGKTRNDQGSAVDGTIDFTKRYGPTLALARKLGVKVIMGEIGGGISPVGPLPAFNGVGKDGKQLQEEYFGFAKAHEDVLVGTWFWMGGKVKSNYRHKVEAGNAHTRDLQAFWGPATPR